MVSQSFSASGALAVAAGLTAVNGVGTFVGLSRIDRLGRKTLLLVGGAGYIVSLAMASICFAIGNGTLAAASIFLFIAAHAVGQAADARQREGDPYAVFPKQNAHILYSSCRLMDTLYAPGLRFASAFPTFSAQYS